MGGVGALKRHARRLASDPAPNPLPRNPARGARGSHSASSGGPRPGPWCWSLERQQRSSGLSQNDEVSIYTLSISQPPQPLTATNR